MTRDGGLCDFLQTLHIVTVVNKFLNYFYFMGKILQKEIFQNFQLATICFSSVLNFEHLCQMEARDQEESFSSNNFYLTGVFFIIFLI